MERLKNLLSRKIYILAIALLGIITLLFMALFLTRASHQGNPQISPTSTPAPSSAISRITVVARNLHWVNNNQLAYTFYDSSSLETRLAITTDKKTSSVIETGLKLKLAQFYWSANNDLLILDTRYPNKTYLLSHENINNVHELPFSGYSYSWSPDSQSIFYLSLEGNNVNANIFNTSSSRISQSFPNMPEFTDSFWSLNQKSIVLFYINTEGGVENTSVSLLDVPTKSVRQLTIQNSRNVSWSPNGDIFVYTNPSGVFLFTPNTNENTLLYPTVNDPTYLSYVWLNNDSLLIFDPKSNASQFYVLNPYTKSVSLVPISMQLSSNQYIEMALSPDKKSLAIATENNGLLFVGLAQ